MSMEKCPNCGKHLPSGVQVHSECLDEFIEYLQGQWKKDVMIGTQKFLLLMLHHSNNVLAVIDDAEKGLALALVDDNQLVLCAIEDEVFYADLVVLPVKVEQVQAIREAVNRQCAYILS